MAALLRLFLSSPGDVPRERLRAELIVDRLGQDYRRYFTLETYRWEYEPMLASGHFQDSIDPPSDCDIVVLIVWSRLGTALPARTAVREYRGIDGRTPVTGTEWEYEDALKAARERGAPDILAFRNVSPVPIETTDAEVRARGLGQLDALAAFWKLRFADRGEFIAGYDTYRTIEEFDGHLERALRKLIERKIKVLDGVGPAPTTPLKGTPFRGLRSYEFGDADIFRGREGITAQAIEQLVARARAGCGFLLVSGPSGSGKSSLVKAALAPRLMRPGRVEGLSVLRRGLFRPSAGGGDIFQGLAEALTRDPNALPELLSPGQSSQDLAAHLRASAAAPGFVFAGALNVVTVQARQQGRLLEFERAKLILVIDQLEELFTGAQIVEADRSLFARLLQGLARAGDVWVVATLRDDFWPQASAIPELANLSAGDGRIDIASPSRLEIAEIIRKPVQAAGLTFETHPTSEVGLDTVLAEEASGEPGVLPLLSFMLDALYAADVEKADRGVLCFASYDELGGLRGAIAKRAETIVSDLPETVRNAVPRVLRALSSTAGVTGATVARPAPLAAFAPGTAARAVVDALLAGRLLVVSNERNTPTLRLAHEALLTRWDRAREQLATDRRDLEMRAIVEAQETRWRKAARKHQAALLLRDPDLSSARDLKLRWGDELAAPEAKFIALSSNAAARATGLRWTILVAVMVGLAALTAASIGALAIAQNQRDGALIAESKGVIRDARAAIASGDAVSGIRLALAALPGDLAHPDRPLLLDGLNALADAYVNRRQIAELGDGDGEAHAISFSPDGDQVVAAYENGTARIWRLADPAKSIALPASQKRLYAASFSPDGSRVVTASADHLAQLWDSSTGDRVGRPMLHGSDVVSEAFSVDGSRLVTGDLEGVAQLWDGRTGAPIGHEMPSGEGSAPMVAFSPDGASILTVSEPGGARLWDAATQTMLRSLSQSDEVVEAAAFSPDGAQVLVGAEDGVVRLFDASTGLMIRPLIGRRGAVSTIAFSPDGKLAATGASDNSATIWLLQTGEARHVLLGHSGPIDTLAFSLDGSVLATASEDRTARLWSVETGALKATLGAHAGGVEALAVSPKSQQRIIATASRDETVRLWKLEPDALAAVLRDEAGPLASARFSADGARAIVVSKLGNARVWDVREGRPPAPLDPPLTNIVTAELSPNGAHIATTSATAPTRIYQVGRLAPTITLGAAADRSASFSPDDKLLVTRPTDGPPRLWDAATGADLGVLEGLNGPVDLAVFSHDGRTLFVAAKGVNAGFWDVATRKPRSRLEGYLAALNSAAFSADGALLVTASFDKTARLWDVASGKSAAPPMAHADAVESAAFSHDGTRVVTVSLDHTAAVWNARSGARVALIKPGGNYTLWLASLSLDGTRVATASDDGTARLWNAATGERIATFAGHDGPVFSSLFSPDGARLLTASADGTARLWRTPAACQALLDAARAEVPIKASRSVAVAPKSGLLFSFYERAQPLLAFLSPSAGETCP